VVVTNKTFSGKTVVITFQNNTTMGQELTALSITWPQATNGNLQSIKMGGTTIYNTSTGGGSLTTSSLLGTTAQRTIAAGASQTLTFTFKNNVDTTASNYTGSATFNPFGPVTMLP
jgi:xanthine dehydrogenase iron-sulfur cluster and FAD-binding subunit A